MSYTYPSGVFPITADIAAVDTFMRQRMSTSGVSGYGIIVDGASPSNDSTLEASAPYDGAKGAFNKALIDSLMCARGYLAQNAAAGVGPANTNSTTYADVGNGSTTGFTTWTVSAPIGKTYLLVVDLSAWSSVAGIAYFRVVVGSTNYETASGTFVFNATSDHRYKTFSTPVVLASGVNTIKLQWKTDGTATAEVDGNDYRSFTLMG